MNPPRATMDDLDAVCALSPPMIPRKLRLEPSTPCSVVILHVNNLPDQPPTRISCHALL